MNPINVRASRYVNNELKPILEIKIIIDLEEAQDNSKLKESIISQLTDFLTNHDRP